MQSRTCFVQFVQGCDLSHLSFRLRHSRHDVMRRFLRRIREETVYLVAEDIVPEALEFRVVAPG